MTCEKTRLVRDRYVLSDARLMRKFISPVGYIKFVMMYVNKMGSVLSSSTMYDIDSEVGNR